MEELEYIQERLRDDKAESKLTDLQEQLSQWFHECYG